MAMSNEVVSMARRLAIIHIVVGALLIIFGIADGATTQRDSDRVFSESSSVFYGLWIGTWMCIAGGLGIPGSTPQRTPTRNCFAGVFMGFSITSSLFGGTIIVAYSTTIAYARWSRYYYYYDYNDQDIYTTMTRRYQRYSYDAKLGLAAVILLLGVIEVVTGIWVSICLCLMKPCCTGSQQQTEGSHGSTPANAANVQTRPFNGYSRTGQATVGGPVSSQAVGNQPYPVVATSHSGAFPPPYSKRP